MRPLAATTFVIGGNPPQHFRDVGRAVADAPAPKTTDPLSDASKLRLMAFNRIGGALLSRQNLSFERRNATVDRIDRILWSHPETFGANTRLAEEHFEVARQMTFKDRAPHLIKKLSSDATALALMTGLFAFMGDTDSLAHAVTLYGLGCAATGVFYFGTELKVARGVYDKTSELAFWACMASAGTLAAVFSVVGFGLPPEITMIPGALGIAGNAWREAAYETAKPVQEKYF